MTEPGLTPEQRESRISELQYEADGALASLRARMAAVAQAQQTALSGTGAATSRDGSVRVTVDATGVVTALEFAETAFERSTPEKLAAATVATIQAAATKAREQLRQTLAPLTSESQGALGAARRGVPGLAGLTVPEVPNTVTDPGDLDDQETPDGYAFDKRIEPDEEPMASPAPSQVRRPRPAHPAEDDYDDGSIYR